MGFEAAPFKLPLDYVEIIGGLDSAAWTYFKKLFKEGFEAARKHSDSLISELLFSAISITQVRLLIHQPLSN